jgi:hypothetical protein
MAGEAPAGEAAEDWADSAGGLEALAAPVRPIKGPPSFVTLSGVPTAALEGPSPEG